MYVVIEPDTKALKKVEIFFASVSSNCNFYLCAELRTSIVYTIGASLEGEGAILVGVALIIVSAVMVLNDIYLKIKV